jgi:hypothetical protein
VSIGRSIGDAPCRTSSHEEPSRFRGGARSGWHDPLATTHVRTFRFSRMMAAWRYIHLRILPGCSRRSHRRRLTLEHLHRVLSAWPSERLPGAAARAHSLSSSSFLTPRPPARMALAGSQVLQAPMVAQGAQGPTGASGPPGLCEALRNGLSRSEQSNIRSAGALFLVK